MAVSSASTSDSAAETAFPSPRLTVTAAIDEVGLPSAALDAFRRTCDLLCTLFPAATEFGNDLNDQERISVLDSILSDEAVSRLWPVPEVVNLVDSQLVLTNVGGLAHHHPPPPVEPPPLQQTVLQPAPRRPGRTLRVASSAPPTAGG